ncbi:27661_t:CDS:2, partial [Dentiscutata erythropus]
TQALKWTTSVTKAPRYESTEINDSSNENLQRKQKTEFQQQEIKELQELIKDMTAKGETEHKLDTNTKASIVLFDEAEKVSNSAVLDALDKVLDLNFNQAHYDKFFEGILNLKYCVFFLTMN